MLETAKFNKFIYDSIVNHWDDDALTDYKGATLQYHDVARKIAKLHLLFEQSGVERGDKIALCGRNSAHWAVAFLATLTYGAVAVPIQHEFKAEQIHNIVNHSEAKLLFIGDVVSASIDASQMPDLTGIVYLPDYSLFLSRSERLNHAREHLNEMFGRKYPKYFRREHVDFYVSDDPEELAVLNYTSGTTGFSKGVMLPYRCLWGNYDFLSHAIGSKIKHGDKVVAILPMAHMYGLMCEFLLQFCTGNHIYFLNRLPSPTVVQEAFAEIKPCIIVSVPLIVEKIVRSKVFPLVQSSKVHMLMNMPLVKNRIKARIESMVNDVFGGNAYEVLLGGAGVNPEVEAFLTSIGFPLTMGYGTTETGPMITYSDRSDFVAGSCGTVVEHMELKIASKDPEHVPGEILTRGTNVMLGYYKNEEATQAVLDGDGWFHTGDLATMSSDGHVFIRGRIKNMLLGSNGQNIYPEEIEHKLNSMAMVNESLVVQKGDLLVGLVYPDKMAATSLGFSDKDIMDVMEENRRKLNSELPAFCKLSRIELTEREFEKTAKKSIKRYLYQQA